MTWLMQSYGRPRSAAEPRCDGHRGGPDSRACPVTWPGPATVVIDAPHGTLAGYRSWSCRCMWCTAAERAATLIVSAAGKP